MEEELSIARDLQVSMLPAECPQIENFDIAAFSVSAREVGGDFYDFIEMDETKAGFVIGDVTGKSVSGALVMSASRSVFRMLSESELTVAESMIRANRRLKKDVKTGMFVALLYAVLNGEDKSVSMCSAGQTQPVLLSAGAGEASLVETEGDTFPLGILDEANYEETRLQLETGEQGAVNQAANALVLSGGGLVVQDLARRLGFEGLSVSAETGPDEAALIVSKYLGNGLYVSYGLGLFDAVDTLRLRYQVNRRLSLEAKSGDEEAADIFYTFERD